MKRYLTFAYATAFTLLVLTGTVSAAGVPLNVGTYDFQLAGGGGGAQATLNGVPVEIFCDDFANEIWAPSSNSANVTTLGSGADLGLTRFGHVAANAWTAITLTGGGADQLFLNSAAGEAAAARYDMVAFLVSLYNVAQGATAANNQIQEAIWTLMDPTVEGPAIDPSGQDPTTYLKQAAEWYIGGGAVDSFLANFKVVSDVNMQVPAVGVGIGGFQEQIVMTPEPRGLALLLFGLLAIGALVFQRSRSRETQSL